MNEAKNDQALIESRIMQLEEQLKNVRILDLGKISTKLIAVGTKVRIKDMDLGEEMTYRIVTPAESNQSMDTITDESPVGKPFWDIQRGTKWMSVCLRGSSVLRFLK